MINQIINYFQTSSGEYWGYVGQHLFLSFTSLIIAMIIALPLGYLGSRNRFVAQFCQTFSQLLRIIPSLALLFILIPFIGTGYTPALIALVVLALPPLFVNTILGFNEVSPTLKEVGLSLGMNQTQLLKQITFPLALPYILNGIKLALVEVIASATLATYIGAGGLGTLIFTGLGLYKIQYVVIGAVSVALLSLISMILLDLAIRKVRENEQFKHVAKKYDKKEIISDLNFEIKKGEFITVLGSSGSGKTTTLKMINGLEKPTSGEIIVNGENLKNANLVNLRRHIGYVVQSIGLFPHMTIAQNIAVTPKLLGWSQDKIDQTVSKLLEVVGLEDARFKDAYPSQLSGGQQQRVGVARALSTNPPIMLFDEPFSALDAITRQNLQQELKTLHKNLNDKTFFFVTHDINEALFLGDRVMVMNNGMIEQFDTPENLIDHPATQYVSDLLGTVQQNKNLWEHFND